MFPPVFPMETEVDLAVEGILKDSPDSHSSTASPPLAQTPPQSSVIGLLTSKRNSRRGQHPVDFALLDPIPTAAVPVEEKSEDLIRAAFPDQGSFLEAQEPWVDQEEMEEQPLRPRNTRKLEESVAENLLREAIMSIAFEVHQMSKLGLSFLFSEAEQPAERQSVNDISTRLRSPPKIKRKQQLIGGRPVVEPVKIHASPSTDIFGQQLATSNKVIRQQECLCPECGRSMAAARFAPHLEKCMGMGRNSSRLANRRLMQATAAERPSSTGSSTSLRSRSTLIGSSSGRAMAGYDSSRPGSGDSDDSDDDEYEFQGHNMLEDDDDWFTTSKRSRGGRKKGTVTKRVEKRLKYRNPLWGEPRQEDNAFFHLGDLLEAPPISRQNEGGGLFNSCSHFSGLMNSDTPSPAGSETIVLRSRKVKKPKTEVSLSNMEENSNSSFPDVVDREERMVNEDDVQVICLDDDEVDLV